MVMARTLEKPVDETILHGSDQKKVPARSVSGTRKRKCGKPKKTRRLEERSWVPCDVCWRIIMRAIFKYHGRYCSVCGRHDHVEGHHIVPRAEFADPHDHSNIVPLCPTCHDYVEVSDVRPRTLEKVIAVGLERFNEEGS